MLKEIKICEGALEDTRIDKNEELVFRKLQDNCIKLLKKWLKASPSIKDKIIFEIIPDEDILVEKVGPLKTVTAPDGTLYLQT